MSGSIGPFKRIFSAGIAPCQLCWGTYGRAKEGRPVASLGTSRLCSSLPEMGTCGLWYGSCRRLDWRPVRCANSSCISPRRNCKVVLECLLSACLRFSSLGAPFQSVQLFNPMGTGWELHKCSTNCWCLRQKPHPWFHCLWTRKLWAGFYRLTA